MTISFINFLANFPNLINYIKNNLISYYLHFDSLDAICLDRVKLTVNIRVGEESSVGQQIIMAISFRGMILGGMEVIMAIKKRRRLLSALKEKVDG